MKRRRSRRRTPRRSSLRRADDVDPAVGIVDPVDGDLVYPHRPLLRQHQQLGVEEPAVVDHRGEQHPGDLSPHGLEAALSITEAAAEQRVEKQVDPREITSRFGPAYHAGAVSQPAADGNIAVAGYQRRQQRQQGVERRRQVDVHVGHYGRMALLPGGAQGAAATLRRCASPAHRGARPPAPRPHPECCQSGVVHDGDDRRPGQVLVEVTAQSTDA